MNPAALLPLLPQRRNRIYPYAFKSAAEFFAGPLETVDDFKDLIERLKAVMDDSELVPRSLYAFLDEDDNGVVDVMDMLYWVDRKLKENKVAIGYTNRLSEAGGDWGATNPGNLAAADPLDLVTTLEGLGCKVALVDHDAADDASASSLNGCVKISRASVAGAINGDITTIGNTAKSTWGLFSSDGRDYRYRFWYQLRDLHERGGGGRRFPIGTGSADTEIAAADCFLLVRNTVAKQVIECENIIGITSSQTQAKSVTIRGYPGEWPEIWCGNSTNDDTDPTECPDFASPPDGTTSGTTAIFYVGYASTKYRDNVHWRNLHFRGKRQTINGDFVFASRIIEVTGAGSGCTIRHCQFTDCQPLHPDDPNAEGFPEYVDFAHGARTSPSYSALVCNHTAFVFDSNYVQPAPDDYPIPGSAHDGSILGFTLQFTGLNQRVTRNRIDGHNVRGPIRLHYAEGIEVADNFVSAPAYKYMLVTGCRDVMIERNYCVTNGKQGDGYSAGGIHINGARNVSVRHNLMATQEPINAGAAGPNVDMLESRAVASSDNDGGFVRFSIPDANQIAVGLKLYIYGHSVAAYNGLHNVTEKSGSAYTTDVPYTSNGTGGRFSIVTDNVAIYGNVVFGVGMTIGYSGGWVDTDVDCNGVQNVVAEHNVIHEFPAANTVNSTAAPVRVKLYADTPSNAPTPQVGTGSMQPELGNAIRENNITRDSGTSAIAVRIGHSATLPALAADFYVATSTALDGFEDNTADAVTFADAVNGDFRIANSGPWDNWFPADMPFSPSLSKAWTPD